MAKRTYWFGSFITLVLVCVFFATGTSFGLTNLLCDSAGCHVDFADSCTSSGPITYEQFPACGFEGYLMTWSGGAWDCKAPPSAGTGVFTITGGSINNTAIGALTPASGNFTTILTTGDATFDISTLKVAASTNRVGIGTASPENRLHIAGGQWDVATTEGDVKIGDATNRLKIGVATSGGGAGISRINAAGTNPKVIVGAAGADVLTVTSSDVEVTGEYKYTAPKTYYKWVAEYDFTRFLTEMSTLRIAFGPVNLPDGADVQKIVCYLVDDDAAEYWDNLAIAYYATDANGVDLNASVTYPTPTNTNSSVATAYTLPTTGTLSGVAYDPVDNASYNYHLEVSPTKSSASASDLKFTGCRIEYRLSAVSP